MWEQTLKLVYNKIFFPLPFRNAPEAEHFSGGADIFSVTDENVIYP